MPTAVFFVQQARIIPMNVYKSAQPFLFCSVHAPSTFLPGAFMFSISICLFLMHVRVGHLLFFSGRYGKIERKGKDVFLMSNIMNGNVQVLPWFDADGKTVEKQLAEASKKQEPLEFCMPGDGEKPEDSPIFNLVSSMTHAASGKAFWTFQRPYQTFPSRMRA